MSQNLGNELQRNGLAAAKRQLRVAGQRELPEIDDAKDAAGASRQGLLLGWPHTLKKVVPLALVLRNILEPLRHFLPVPIRMFGHNQHLSPAAQRAASSGEEV